MAKTRQVEEQQLQAVKDDLQSSQRVVFAADQGLTVADSTDLRNKLRQEKSGWQVVKKTLLKKAEADLKLDLSQLESAGTVAMAFSAEDAVAPARLVQALAKDSDKLQILGGLLEGVFIAKERVIALAKLPGRDQLLANLVGTIQAPVSGLVNVLAGNLRGLVNVLTAIKDKKV